MKFRLILFWAVLIFLFPERPLAVCPVCTVAVGAGLGLCRFWGIDDTVAGVWIGGLILSSGLWLSGFLQKKGLKLPYPDIWSVAFMALLTLPPLYLTKMIGIAGNTLWGVDKILLGTISGSFFFLLGVGTDKLLRKMNEGKGYIYFQKVIIPILYLAILSYIYYRLAC